MAIADFGAWRSPVSASRSVVSAIAITDFGMAITDSGNRDHPTAALSLSCGEVGS